MLAGVTSVESRTSSQDERPRTWAYQHTLPCGGSGAVVLAQRFGGVQNLDLHFHALVLDGVYTSPGLLDAPRFQPAPELAHEDVARVTTLLHRRIVRYLQRRGRRPRGEPDEPVPDEPRSRSSARPWSRGASRSDQPAVDP